MPAAGRKRAGGAASGGGHTVVFFTPPCFMPCVCRCGVWGDGGIQGTAALPEAGLGSLREKASAILLCQRGKGGALLPAIFPLPSALLGKTGVSTISPSASRAAAAGQGNRRAPQTREDSDTGRSQRVVLPVKSRQETTPLPCSASEAGEAFSAGSGKGVAVLRCGRSRPLEQPVQKFNGVLLQAAQMLFASETFRVDLANGLRA